MSKREEGERTEAGEEMSRELQAPLLPPGQPLRVALRPPQNFQEFSEHGLNTAPPAFKLCKCKDKTYLVYACTPST